jgi:prevent-host-death family protein
MATGGVTRGKKPISRRQKTAKLRHVVPAKEIGAGEFKAKCLAIIDEVNQTGQEVVITKRGKPTAKLIPFEEKSVESLFGRLKGIVTIVGDPDDLIKPVFPEEDWDMLK